MKRAKKQVKEKQHTVVKQEKKASDELAAEGKKPESKLTVRPMHNKPLRLS